MGSGSRKQTSAVAPPTHGDLTIYVAQDPVDFRLGINGLPTMVEATLAHRIGGGRIYDVLAHRPLRLWGFYRPLCKR